MKKCFFVIMAVLVLAQGVCYAGSVPEDLLHSDGAQIFFAEVIPYHPNKETPDIEFNPVKNIKGDIIIGSKQVYDDPVLVGITSLSVGDVYLLAYFDQYNPTYVFEASSYDTESLMLKGISDYDMYVRFQAYLNDGSYDRAEKERLERSDSLQEAQAVNEPLAPIKKTNDKLIIFMAAAVLAILIAACVFLTKKRKEQKSG